jgi:pimeloyl-ACP methyl ester carboxylesterase
VTPEEEPELPPPAAFGDGDSGSFSSDDADFPFTCGYQSNVSQGAVRLTRTQQAGPGIPAGYEVIESFRAVNCDRQALDVTFSIPDHYKDVRVLRCGRGGCTSVVEEEVSRTAVCAGTPLESLRREELLRRRTVKPQQLAPIVGRGEVIAPDNRVVRTDNYRIEFTGSLPVRFPVRLGAPRADLPAPLNPSLSIIGTPLVVHVDDPPDVPLPAAIQLPVPQAQVEPDSTAIYVLLEGRWLPLGGERRGTAITVAVDDLRAFLQDGTATFAVLGIACFACTEGVLKPVYEPEGVRNAVVLVHGFGASPRTWQPFIDEVVRSRQPFQAWVYGYPFTQTTDVSGRELADQLQLQASRYDRLYLVGHSLGGIIMEKALALAHGEPGRYDFIGKARAAISLGAPHDGVPLIRVLEQFAGSLADTPTAYSTFNPRSAAAQEMQRPFSIPRVEGIPYYVVAGTRPLATTANLFEEANDGVTTVKGAQRIGDGLVQDTCRDFFPVPLTHPELNDEANARQLVARIIARDIAGQDPGAALLGYNQYARVQVASCSQDEVYVIVGVRIPEEAAAQPLGCGCGNGVCGVDETEESCPTDCGRFISRTNLCFGLAVLAYAFLIALVVLTTVHLGFELARKPELGRRHHAVKLAMLVLGLVAFAAQLVICQYVSLPAYALLLVATVLLIIDFVKRRGHFHRHGWERYGMEGPAERRAGELLEDIREQLRRERRYLQRERIRKLSRKK